jgi:hypothetical protein
MNTIPEDQKASRRRREIIGIISMASLPIAVRAGNCHAVPSGLPFRAHDRFAERAGPWGFARRPAWRYSS